MDDLTERLIISLLSVTAIFYVHYYNHYFEADSFYFKNKRI